VTAHILITERNKTVHRKMSCQTGKAVASFQKINLLTEKY